MSDLANKIFKLIKLAFPQYFCQPEHYVVYCNTKLFFDFYLPELKLVIEVQGQQHYSFNKFFHKGKDEFEWQKYRDTLKVQWASNSGIKLLSIKYNEVNKLTKDSFYNLVVNSL